MDDSVHLPTEFLIKSRIRIAAREGIPMVIRHHGDNNSGTILLKINLLDGTSQVMTQIRLDDKLVWSPAMRSNPVTETDAESYLERQLRNDPDVWIVEVEDKQGRLWFDGPVLTSQ